MSKPASGVISSLMQTKTGRAAVVALAIMIGGTSLQGCYGTFPLTRALYDINGEITDNGVIHSIIMIVLGIFGVYGICMFVDYLVLNSVEFWTGEDMDFSSNTQVQPDGSVVAFEAVEGTSNQVMFTHTKDGEVISRTVMERQADGTTLMFDGEGTLRGSVQADEDGMLSFFNAKGKLIQEISAQDLTAVAAAS